MSGFASGRTVRFRDFTLDIPAYELRRKGRVVRLEQQPMDLLILLVERRHQLVSRQEIADRLWGADVFVDVDSGIHAAVRKVRQALHDSPAAPVFIDNVPGKGYRFIAPVEAADSQPGTAPGALPEPPSSTRPSPDHERQPSGSAGDEAGVSLARHAADEGLPTRWPGRLLVLAGGLGLLALVAVMWFGSGPRAAPPDSLAILPFANTTGDADLDYVADGLAEILINQLSTLEGLRVVPRPAAFRFRGREGEMDPASLGEQLGVRAVLTGRVAQLGESLLVQADLTDASTNAQIWGARYHRPMADLITIQHDIAQAISSEMRLRLGVDDRTRLDRAPTADGEAYLLYLRGVHHYYKATLKDLDKAVDHFTSAIARDAGFALAHAWLGATHFRRQQWWGIGPPVESVALARAAVDRALALDDRLAEAYLTRGRIRLSFDWDVAAAERDIRHALELDPRSPLAHGALYGWLRTQRRSDEALAAIRQMLALDPLSMWANTELAVMYLFTGRHAEALTQMQRTVELDDSYPPAPLVLRGALSASGRADEALLNWIDELRRNGDHDRADLLRQAFAEGGVQKARLAERDRLLALARTTYVPSMRIAYAAAAAGDVDGALEHLQRAYDIRQGDVATMHVNPRLANLWDDPRFIDLVRRVGVDPQARQ